jgi:pilus assembly protein CpaE
VIKIVIGAAEQSLAYDLRAALTEMESVDAVFVAESTDELVSAVLRLDPDVVLVHDHLGPDPVLPMIRDLALRRATTAALVVTTAPTAAQFGAAMDAGARGLVSYPPTFEELQSRVAAAGDWAQQMRRMLAGANAAEASGAAGRARVITITGAKGGVGATTVATHLALDVVRTVAGHRVCLLDLDLEKGDVAGILQVRHRASIADVAKVSEDLSAQAVGDAVVVHESGLHLLLSPLDVREVEAVDPRSLREVVAVLRREYDLVVIDAGSHVTPVQATVVELADEVICVATPDVLAMRSLRRAITQWEGLGVRKESELNVLLNRVSKQTTVSAETVRQLTRAPVLPVGLPAMFRRLEPALNSRDPLSLREDVWWRTLRTVGHEVGVVRPRDATPDRPDRPDRPNRPDRSPDPSPRSRRRRNRRSDSGQASLETVGILPLLITLCLIVWQAGVYGVSLVWSGHAANAAARAVSLHQDPDAAARQAVPGYVASNISVTSSGSTVTVRYRVPLMAPVTSHSLGTITTSRSVVEEP